MSEEQKTSETQLAQRRFAAGQMRAARKRQLDQRQHAQELDIELFVLVRAANQEIHDFPFIEGKELRYLVDICEMAIRELNYGRKSVQSCTKEEFFAELLVDFDNRKNLSFFADALGSEITEIARKHHLTPKLTELELQALEALVKFFNSNPKDLDEYFVLLTRDEFNKRKLGMDTYEPPIASPQESEPDPAPGLPVERLTPGGVSIGACPTKEEELETATRRQIERGRLEVLRNETE